MATSGNIEVNLQTLASKEDIAMVREDIAKLECSLSEKIAESKTDILKWMFCGFFVTLITIIGLYFKK